MLASSDTRSHVDFERKFLYSCVVQSFLGTGNCNSWTTGSTVPSWGKASACSSWVSVVWIGKHCLRTHPGKDTEPQTKQNSFVRKKKKGCGGGGGGARQPGSLLFSLVWLGWGISFTVLIHTPAQPQHCPTTLLRHWLNISFNTISNMQAFCSLKNI